MCHRRYPSRLSLEVYQECSYFVKHWSKEHLFKSLLYGRQRWDFPVIVETATHSSPALCGKSHCWDTLASFKELFRRKLEEGLVAALPFMQEWLQGWGCHTWPQFTWALLPPHCRCLCLTPLTQTQTDFPVWHRNCLIPGISPGDCFTLADPATASGPALSRSHWLVFWASSQPCLITINLSDLFKEPGVNAILLWALFLSPDPPCWDPEGWGPGWWVPHAARLVSMLCPDSPALTASHPLLGWQSRWNWEYRPDTHKIKVWHRVRALLSWKKNPRASC